MLRIAAIVLVGSLASGVLAAQHATPDQAAQDPLLARAAAYVSRFEKAFANVVCEERYEQNVVPGGRTYIGGPRAQRRELVSDFLLVRLPESDDWLPFRDVFEVDGARVRDHDDRLVKLFVTASGTAADRAADITDESARYNIGMVRTVNHPLLALQVVRASQQHRFKFSAAQSDRAVGTTSIVEYHEQERPTMVHGPAGRDMPMRGRLWIDPATGTVLQTEVLIDAVGVSAAITTKFADDQTFGVAVPIEMSEDYRQPNGTHVTGTARYARFRAFRVDVDYGRGR